VAPHSLLHSVLFGRADSTPKLDDTERSHHWVLAATYAAVYRYPTARAAACAKGRQIIGGERRRWNRFTQKSGTPATSSKGKHYE
jgi:hypothetical protein